MKLFSKISAIIIVVVVVIVVSLSVVSVAENEIDKISFGGGRSGGGGFDGGWEITNIFHSFRIETVENGD